jgi:hypothetical protein
MPYANQHAFRVADPKQYTSFARKNIDKGLDVILGIKDGKSEVQAYRFDKDIFTYEEAKKWIKEHKIKVIEKSKAVQSFTIYSKLQSFTQNEIVSLLPNGMIGEIKKNNPHPFFQVYAIAHEGISKPKVIGEGYREIVWSKNLIKSIVSIVKKGVQFFVGHNNDNSINGRRSVGEVVHTALKEVNGKLCALAIGLFRNKDEAKQYDVCSIEANTNLIEDGKRYIAESIEQITGIALGNSSKMTPAFSGAKRLGMLQAFEDSDVEIKVEKRKKTGESKMISFDEIKQGIKERNVFPNQLFTMDDLKNDRTFGNYITEMEKQISDLKKQFDETVKNKADIEGKLKDYEVKTQRFTAKEKFDKLISEKQLTDKEKMFVEKNYEQLSDYSDKGLTDFIEGQQKAYKDYANIFGVKEEPLPVKSMDKTKNKTDELYTAAGNELLKFDYKPN